MDLVDLFQKSFCFGSTTLKIKRRVPSKLVAKCNNVIKDVMEKTINCVIHKDGIDKYAYGTIS